jgi:hypothetical protein
MKAICDKAGKYDVCEHCYHGKEHDAVLPQCLNSKCMLVANAFALDNYDCTQCKHSETCEQYEAKKQSSEMFIKRKEHEEKMGRTFHVYDEQLLSVQQRLRNPVVNLINSGEDCGKYRELLFTVSCKEVK